MKFAVVSHALPPSLSGQAMILFRLLKDLSPDSYCLISSQKSDSQSEQNNFTQKLAGRYYQLPSAELFKRGSRFGLAKWRKRINLFPSILLRGRQIAKIIRQEKCTAVVACTGDVLNLPSAYVASRLTGIRFFPYIFDHYSYREWYDPEFKTLARLCEPTLLKNAAKVIVPNEILRDEIRRQYGVEAAIIHNSCDLASYQNEAQPAQLNAGDEKSIVYTGDIYEAHYDAFRNLLAALDSLKHLNVKLHLYTSRSRQELEGHNLHGAIVYHQPESFSAIPDIQKSADMLFLPLAFDSPYPDLVRTSATTKLGEYLAARRPVITHAPPDSFVSWYARRHDCAVVVDQNNPARLAEAIEQLVADADLQHNLGERAWRQAQTDFSISTAQANFVKVLEQQQAASEV